MGKKGAVMAKKIDVTGEQPISEFFRKLGQLRELVQIVVNERVIAEVLPQGQISSEDQLAWERLKKLQRKSRQAIEEQGITEDDVMQVILEDD